jgi:anti-sigma B factor antagonist
VLEPEQPVPAFHFAVEQKTIDGVSVLAVRGDIDMLTAPILTQAVSNVLTEDAAALIIDLTEVDFLASLGMAVLVTAQQECGDAKRLVVVADGSATSRPLKLVGLDTVLNLHPSLDEALKALSLS